MIAALEVLVAGGVPLGAPRPAPSVLDGPALRAALVALGDGAGLGHAEREALAAWSSAFEHHWPDRFARVLGEPGRSWLLRLRDQPGDDNRYLKLRRIACENLARAAGAARPAGGCVRRSGCPPSPSRPSPSSGARPRLRLGSKRIRARSSKRRCRNGRGGPPFSGRLPERRAFGLLVSAIVAILV